MLSILDSYKAVVFYKKCIIAHYAFLFLLNAYLQLPGIYVTCIYFIQDYGKGCF